MRPRHDAVSSLDLLERAGSGQPLPPPEPMPTPCLRSGVPMRDGTRLDTQVWLPDGEPTPRPAILLRTPYKESVMGFKRLGVLRYVQHGYAVVMQQIRGVGASEGRFGFSAPHERDDGHDTVEWIAAQPWCNGAVGMDGSSYVAMTQLAAAATRPPHLRCIVPAVPSVDFFREVPYSGGIFSRLHTLNWTRLLQIDSLNELKAGFMGTLPVLAHADVMARMTSRPLQDAAEGDLRGDYLQHYRDVLEHPSFDDWWRARTLDAADYARMDLPTLVINGNFDLTIGAMTLWRGLEANAARPENRVLLVGPWDHGQCYAGGVASFGPYELGADAVLDLPALRLAFFDRHLKGVGPGPALPAPGGRVQLFVTGANRWFGFDRYPPRETQALRLHLSSRGHANSVRGDGRLLPQPPGSDSVADVFVDDPGLPFVPALASAAGALGTLDLRERERHHETLVYDSGVLPQAVTLLGEGEVQLSVAADVPDADVFVWLAEHRADGRTVKLAAGQLRLRCRLGYQAEHLLTPDQPVAVRLPLTYVAHRVPAGSRLRLLVAGSNFPLSDPNPHTGEPVASAVSMRVARQQVLHGAAHPSWLQLPVLPD